MEYGDLLNSQSKYGITKEDILKHRGYEEILENVVIAPWWSHTMFENHNLKIVQVSKTVYNIYGENVSFSFLELKRIGAPAVMDYYLSLGLTKCKNILFVGSAGSLSDKINIGDLIIPSCSICGEGASRYLNKDLEDEFGKEEYPYGELTQSLIDICNKGKYQYMSAINYSTDTVFAQYSFMDYIKDTGAKTIEMETSLLFKCSNMLKISTAALLCISDNTVAKKTLYSQQIEKENEYRHIVRNNIIPEIIIDLFTGYNKQY